VPQSAQPPGVASAAVDISIEGRTAAYEAALAKMPGITEAYARKSSQAMQRAFYVQQAKQIAGLVDTNEKAAATTSKVWADVGKKVGELAGGPFAKLAQVVFDLVPKSAAASNALGVVVGAGAAVGGVVVGIAAVGTAIKSLADAALVAETNLRKAGLAGEIPTRSRDSLREYREATTALAHEVDFLQVEVGAAVSGPLTDLTEILANVSQWLRVGKGDLEEEQVATAAWGAAMATVNPIGVAFIAMLRGQAEGTKALVVERKKLTEAELDYIQTQAELDDAARRDAAKRGEKQIADQRKALEQAAVADIALAQQKQRELARIAEAAAKADAALQLQRQAEAIKAHNDELAAEVEWQTQLAQARLEVERTNADLRVQLAQDEATRKKAAEASWVESARQLNEQRAEAAIQTAKDIKAAEFALMSATVDGLHTLTQIAADTYKARGEQGRQHARFLAGAEKAMAITAIGIDTAAAIMQGFAMFGPPPSPAGLAAAAAAVIAGTTQAAAVAATPMPSFFGGVGRSPGSPGQPSPTMQHGGERTLTNTAADTWGDAFIDAMNAGLAPLQLLAQMGGGGSSSGDLVIDGMRLGRYVRKQARDGRQYGAASPYQSRK
jgi:hypothetical protein